MNNGMYIKYIVPSAVNIVFMLSSPVLKILVMPISPPLNSGRTGNEKIPIWVCFTIPKFNNRKYISGIANIKIGILKNYFKNINFFIFLRKSSHEMGESP